MAGPPPAGSGDPAFEPVLSSPPDVARPSGHRRCRSRRRVPLWPVVAVAVALGVGLLHAALVARRYFVGSFDDDAAYILTAKALLHGAGLTGHLTTGTIVAGSYPPGYSALLVPLIWLFPHGFGALRLLSVVCFAALFPMTWRYLGRRGVGDGIRFSVLMLLALNPVLGTFAGMVMAEAPFLVLFLVFLDVVERWDRTRRVLGPAGIGVIVAAAGLVWLKEAAVGLVVGLALWLLLRREVRKAGALITGVVLSLVPVLIARIVAGVPLAGARYSQELGGYYSGGLTGRLVHVLPSALWHYLSVALPASVVPLGGSPMPKYGLDFRVLQVVAWHVPLFCLIGFVIWVRRHRDATVAMIPVYTFESLLWPYVNERRVILVLPVMLAFYGLGLWSTGAWLVGAAQRRRGRPRTWQAGLATLAAAVIVFPLVVQFPRDYLFELRQTSSHPEGSRYMAILAHTADPTAVVESDYLYTTALFTGHPTADNAFINTVISCTPDVVHASLALDRPGYLLIGALNKAYTVDSPCLLAEAVTAPWAVRLLRTYEDQASVFELIGPGTTHPDLTDVTAGATLSGSAAVSTVPAPSTSGADQPGTTAVTTSAGGVATLTWTWNTPAAVTQASVGEAGVQGAPTAGMVLQLRSPAGDWFTVASADRAVGFVKGDVGYLLGSMAPTAATAMRLVIRGNGSVSATDVHVLAAGTGPTG